MNQQQTKDEILLATLPHVAFDGWTARALAAGTADAGLTPDMALRAFPGAMVEVAEHFSEYADRQMTAALARRAGTELSGRQRVALALRLRLEELAPHREAVRRVIAFLGLPHNATVAARGGWRTVDAIWARASATGRWILPIIPSAPPWAMSTRRPCCAGWATIRKITPKHGPSWIAGSKTSWLFPLSIRRASWSDSPVSGGRRGPVPRGQGNRRR